MFEQSTILVTGGTGSFGNDFIRLALRECNPREIIVFSRDEKKQHDMRLSLNDDRVSFVIGDVRDRDHVFSTFRGVDYVFHAAALKQVPSCEFFPMEAVQTNVLGTHHVLEAAEVHGIRKLVVLSTDKAVYPINAMGLTKALMEKLMLARAKAPRTQTVLCGVRYGNVMYSRGSVIPLFVQQIKSGQPLTVTNADMTRLLLPLSDAVKLVLVAMEHGQQGDLFVRKAPAATVQDLCTALLRLFEADNRIDVIGTREGEKQHEVLLTAEEIGRAESFDEYYRVPSSLRRDYVRYYSAGDPSYRYVREGYTSENAARLSVRQVEQLLLSLPEIQAELNAMRDNAQFKRMAA